MRRATLILFVSVLFTFMIAADASYSVQPGVVVSAAAPAQIAFRYRPMPTPLIRPRPVVLPVVRRPVYRRSVVVAPVVTVAPPPPAPIVVAPGPQPVRQVRLPLVEPVVINPQPGTSGHYEVRTRIAPSGERYEERVWVAAP